MSPRLSSPPQCKPNWPFLSYLSLPVTCLRLHHTEPLAEHAPSPHVPRPSLFIWAPLPTATPGEVLPAMQGSLMCLLPWRCSWPWFCIAGSEPPLLCLSSCCDVCILTSCLTTNLPCQSCNDRDCLTYLRPTSDALHNNLYLVYSLKRCLELLIYWLSTITKNIALGALGLYEINWRLKKYCEKDKDSKL